MVSKEDLTRDFDVAFVDAAQVNKQYKGQEGADGMKYDNGKLLAAIPFQDFPLALKAVAEISTYGAKKYKRSSWKTVPNAEERYWDAGMRHFLELQINGLNSKDEESGLLHYAHYAWNVLATLQLLLERTGATNANSETTKDTIKN